MHLEIQMFEHVKEKRSKAEQITKVTTLFGSHIN